VILYGKGSRGPGWIGQTPAQTVLPLGPAVELRHVFGADVLARLRFLSARGLASIPRWRVAFGVVRCSAGRPPGLMLPREDAPTPGTASVGTRGLLD
jgi:hypothetical protein